jgi:TolB-like protein/tetratricopeptide (TPR) repeat protein
MQLSAEPSRVFRFAGFELDVRTRELRTSARRIRLQEQPFEILRMMLERPGDVVTRDELQRRLWPEGTFVDFEHALNAAVKRLRAALGDDAERPRFVETLPRRGYRFIAKLDGLEHVASIVAPPQSSQPRLVVLPFTNLSNDPTQEYFSDGLTEELIAQLGAFYRGRIGVIARWSSMTFKGTSQRARVIGEALRANYLLEGSVRHEDERVRITVRLIEAASETQIWSNSYEREVSDCSNAASGRLSVQTDVASCVARALAVELAPAPSASPTAPALAPTAYQAYLKGRYHWNTRGSEGLDDALTWFTRVVEETPTFGAGHAALARTRIAFAESYQRAPRQELAQARDAAIRALELDPELAEAHLAMGDVHRLLNWDWRSAEASYSRAVMLNPSFESVHRSYGALLVSLDRPDEAVREVERACDLDPLCLISTLSAARVHYLVGDYDRAAEKCRHSIDMDPERVHAHRLLGAVLLQVDDHERAVAALETALTISPDDPITLAWLAHARAVNGDRAGAEALAERLRVSATYVSPYHLALAHAGLGDSDAAFAALDAACVDRDPMVALVAIEPRFERIRRDPRYATLRDYLKLDRPAA